MRTSSLINDCLELEQVVPDPFVYSPLPYESVESVDGVTKTVSTDPVKFQSQFKVSDFSVKTLIDAGIDPSRLSSPMLSVDAFEFLNRFDSVSQTLDE